MADSTITKQALANALKELIKEEPFDKINVIQICDRCNMSRKSFYYHFRDKYDLVNWIFDMEFNAQMTRFPQRGWRFFEAVCVYFHENREFYRKVLAYRGQNSFSEHFKEVLHPLLRVRMKELFDKNLLVVNGLHPICLNFLTDGITCSIERWLMENPEMSPQEFGNTIKALLQIISNEHHNNPEFFE